MGRWFPGEQARRDRAGALPRLGEADQWASGRIAFPAAPSNGTRLSCRPPVLQGVSLDSRPRCQAVAAGGCRKGGPSGRNQRAGSCSRLLGRTLLYGSHIRAEHCVHPRLVTRTLSLEPLEHILVYTQRDRLLGLGMYQRSSCEEVRRKVRQLGRRGALDGALGRLPETGKVRPTLAGPFTLARGLRSTLGAHGDCSGEPR